MLHGRYSHLMAGVLAVSILAIAQSGSAAVYMEDFESYAISTSAANNLRTQNPDWTPAPAVGGADVEDFIFQDATAVNGTQVLRIRNLSSTATFRGVRHDGISVDGFSGPLGMVIDTYIESNPNGNGISVVFSQSSSRRFEFRLDTFGIRSWSSGTGATLILDANGDPVTTWALDKWYRFEFDAFIDPVASDSNVSTYNLGVTNLTDNVFVGGLMNQGAFGDPTLINSVSIQAMSTSGIVRVDNLGISVVPEPGALGLFGAALLLTLGSRRRQRQLTRARATMRR